MKRLWSLLFTLLLIPCLAVAVAAEETSGSCGESAVWEYDAESKILTVSGKGAMQDYEKGKAPWTGLSIGKVVIKNGITGIGEYAFCQLRDFTRLSLPVTLADVSENAFYGCSDLNRIYIKDVAAWLKLDCEAITGVKRYQRLYLNGEEVKNLVIPDGVTEIPDYAFYGFNKMDSVTIPESVERIGNRAFLSCTGLDKIDFSEGLKEIGVASFASCLSLNEIALPDSVESIGDRAFAYCYYTPRITLGESLASIGEGAFRECRTVKKITVPEGVTVLEKETFALCWDLEQVGLPKSLKQIDTRVFAECNQLYAVTYGGTKARKETIVIADAGNAKLREANWTCTNGVIYGIVEAPTLKVTVDAESGLPKLDIDNATNVRNRIYRSTRKDGGFKYLDSFSIKENGPYYYYDETAEPGKTYYYKVNAVNRGTGNVSEFSNVCKALCCLEAPYVHVKNHGDTGKPVVQWDEIEGAEMYLVYRKTWRKGEYERILKTDDVTKFHDKTAVAGKDYYYMVRAVAKNREANSQCAYEDFAYCRIKTPTVTVTRNDDGDPVVKWDTIKGAVRYYVYRCTTEYGTYVRVKEAVKARTFTDTTAKAGQKYYYTVRAVDENGYYSEFAWAKAVTAK